MSKHHSLPQPDEVSIEEREDAMGGYLMMFAAIAAGLPLPIINLIAAVIYYYINRKKSRFVHFHSAQSVLSQLPTSIMNAVLVFWTLRILFYDYEYGNTYWGYLVTVILANLFYFGFSIWAAIKARRGQMYYFIFFGRISYDIAFKIRENENNPVEAVNLPPK
tara:strand:+ start:20190 stop:20678 length:489 start_codon:yes stop_codon:yes gene_type:complete